MTKQGVQTGIMFGRTKKGEKHQKVSFYRFYGDKHTTLDGRGGGIPTLKL